MEQEKNDILLDDLFEARGAFDNLINEMRDLGIVYPYEDTISEEEKSYANAFNAISRMNGYTEEYNYLMDENVDFFEEEIRIYVKYAILYGASIILLKLFSKTLSAREISEIWYGLVGLLLGSVNMGVINKNVNDHRYGTKESRDLMNRLSTLKERYKEDYSLAYKEVQSLFDTNNKLWKELDKGKVLKK